MAGAQPARIREPDDLAQAAPHPVALDGMAHLSRHGEPNRTAPCSAPQAPAHESLARRPRTARHSSKIASASSRSTNNKRRFRSPLSHLRPRTRRAATTSSPAVVAMRARDPCRRLRTNLLVGRFVSRIFSLHARPATVDQRAMFAPMRTATESAWRAIGAAYTEPARARRCDTVPRFQARDAGWKVLVELTGVAAYGRSVNA